MSRTSRIPYFQNLFDMMDVVALQRSAKSVAQIAAWEKRTKQSFPGVMAEFYSTSVTLCLGGDQPRNWTLTLPKLWSEYSNDERGRPTGEVLRYSDHPERIQEAVEPGPYFWVMTENQGNWLMYSRANGEDDPPTYVTSGEMYFLCPPALYRENLRWCCLGRFTEVLFDWFVYYNYQLERDLGASFVPLRFKHHATDPSVGKLAPKKLYDNGIWLRTPDEPFQPPVIDFLIDRFGEPERTPRAGGVTTYTYRPPDGTIRVTADEPALTGGLSAWWVHADTPERLAEFAALLFPWGTLRDTLRADTDPAREVLRQLKGERPA